MDDKKFIEQFYWSEFSKNIRIISDDDRNRIQVLTKGQTENELWTALKLNRTTASNLSNTIIKEYSPFGKMMTYFKYGIDEETKLKKNTFLWDNCILKLIEQNFTSISTIDLHPGIFLSKLGVLGASPDAFIHFDNGQKAIIEIKCPFVFKIKTLDEYTKQLITCRKGNKNTLCLINVALIYDIKNDKFTINKNHKHFKQIQCQLYCSEYDFAIYIVKSCHQLNIFKIDKIQSFMGEFQVIEDNIVQKYKR